jgi:L-threonylcarbamoyladenylate synthase
MPNSIVQILMEMLPLSPSALSRALEILEAGGTVVHPTETCYGIACDLTNPAAVLRLFRVKARPLTQPVSALFSSIEAAGHYIECSPRALEIATKYLPGPLTIVLPTKACISKIFVTPSTLHSPLSTSIGIRISSHLFAAALSAAYGKPIATTSANLHGHPNPYSVADIASQWKGISEKPDLVIDGGSLPIAPPSTVIEITGNDLKVLRKGDIAF